MRRRLRSTCKWGGAVLTVLLLVVWVGSRWWACSTNIPYVCHLYVGGGSLMLNWSNSAALTPTSFTWSGLHRSLLAFEWTYHHHRITSSDGETVTLVFVPIWQIAIVAALATAWLWYRDRRRAPGLCVKCGYDLRGADHAVCPECGAALPLGPGKKIA